MGLFNMASNVIIKSTTKWVANAAIKLSNRNWDAARNDLSGLLLVMVQHRPGTPSQVIDAIHQGRVSSLSNLCITILLAENSIIDDVSISEKQAKSRSYLIDKGIPADIA